MNWKSASISTAAALLFFLTPDSAAATTLTRYPYVNIVTPNSATIAWKTDIAGQGTVVYSTDRSYSLSATDAASDTMHAVTLGGLDPGTDYFYRVVAGPDTLTSPIDSFRTAPTPSPTASFRFVAFGDLGRATQPQKDIAALLPLFSPDFAILTGDIIYDNGEPENFDPQYFQIYQPTLAAIPFYTSIGNHDLYQNGGAAYLSNYYLPTNSATNTERYYSFDYGNAHFVALEIPWEGVVPDATMLTWLDQDLAASSKLWKFVFFHVPGYSNSAAHGGDATIAAAVEPIFLNRGVDVVFQGHNHFYTRTFPIVNGVPVDTAQEPNYTNPSGPVWIVTGGGGRSLYPIDVPGPTEAYSVSDYHFVSVFINGPILALEAISSTGDPFDGMSIVKTPPTSVTLADFEAAGSPDGVRLRWKRVDGGNDGGFNIYRSRPEAVGAWTRVNSDLLVGGPSFEYLDQAAEPGITYSYRLGIVDGQGAETMTSSVSAIRETPLRFAVERPRPNPTRGSASIPITLDRPSRTRVAILDVSGRVVRTLLSRDLPAGPHQLVWDGRDGDGRPVASGLYFAVVRAGDREARVRVALLR